MIKVKYIADMGKLRRSSVRCPNCGARLCDIAIVNENAKTSAKDNMAEKYIVLKCHKCRGNFGISVK
ncbi:MAG: hypothetical protein ACI4JB_02780 [Porcipelethomonas sp.]